MKLSPTVMLALTLAGGLAGAAAAQTVTTPNAAPAIPNGHGGAAPPNAPNAARAAANTPDTQPVRDRSEIAQAQRELMAEGLYRGPIDGALGPRTREALADFQLRDGLPRTATLDSRTAARLKARSTDAGVGSSLPTVLRGTPVTPNGARPSAVPAPNEAGGNAAE